MCKKLEEETEIASWTENGGLFVGTNAERLAEYKRFAETGKYFGIESHVLSPEEVKKAGSQNVRLQRNNIARSRQGGGSLTMDWVAFGLTLNVPRQP